MSIVFLGVLFVFYVGGGSVKPEEPATDSVASDTIIPLEIYDDTYYGIDEDTCAAPIAE